MAWVRCCGSGLPSVVYPIDLLTYLTWDLDPRSTQYVDAYQTKYWTSTTKTPKLKPGLTLSANLCSYGRSSSIYSYIEVSEDGVTWTQVAENTGPAGQLVTASLNSYVGKQLFIRVKVYHPGPAGYGTSIAAIYPSATGVFQIS